MQTRPIREFPVQLVVITLLLGSGSISCDRSAPKAQPVPPPKVTVAHPQVRSIAEYDEYNGWMEAPESVEVRARVRGHIVKVHFTDGQHVKKGDLLFELDPRPFQDEIDRAVEEVGIYQAQLNFALVDEKRLKDMQKTGVATYLEVETAEAKARSLEAQVEANKKEVDRRRLELTYSRVDAPIAGRIGRALMTEGNLVNAGGTDPLLTTITSTDPMYIYFNLDERALQRYQKRAPTTASAERTGVLKDRQMPFFFGLETDEGYPHEGVLDFADNRVEPTTGTIMVRGVVPNPERLFVPGSRVRVRVPMGDRQQLTLIPETAILSDQDRKYVLVVDDKNIVQRRDIQTGRLLDDGMRVVLPSAGGQGLSATDSIITIGLQSARINYPVEPVQPTSQPAS